MFARVCRANGEPNVDVLVRTRLERLTRRVCLASRRAYRSSRRRTWTGRRPEDPPGAGGDGAPGRQPRGRVRRHAAVRAAQPPPLRVQRHAQGDQRQVSTCAHSFTPSLLLVGTEPSLYFMANTLQFCQAV
jgi:hypothetical protein